MATTALKQMTIPSISTAIIGSPRVKQLTREMKKGDVCQVTMTSEIGAIVTARLNRKKFTYPVTIRQNIWCLAWLGNILSGLKPLNAHQITATMKRETLRKTVNSAT